MPAQTTLAQAAARFADGNLDSAAFAAEFATGDVYAVRPPPPAPPGLVAVGQPGAGHVLVFTSLAEVARQAGECDWLRTTGDDLLSLVPDGYGVVVDAASDHPVALSAGALRRGPVPDGGFPLMAGELALGAAVADLVPGNPDNLERLVARCTTLARGLGAAADRIRAIHAGEWVGPAGDAFRQVVEDEPGRYATAAEAFAGTGAAVASYRLTLIEAQGTARRALATLDDAEAASAAWRRQDEPAPVDPGGEGRDRARALLNDARARVRAAGDQAARRTEAAWADAPREPNWWESAGHFVAEIGRGAWEATAGMVELAWSISTVRMMVDPEGWERDVTALGEGLLYGVTHPVEFGKAILDWDTWQESPGRAIGHLIPDLLITLATAGGGAAARGGRTAKAVDELADMGTTLRRLDRMQDASARLTFLERAKQLLPGRERPLSPPNVPPGSPAGRAAAFQGQGLYPGVDDWYTVRLGAGDEVAAGSVAAHPELRFSGFAVPRQVADDVGGNARELFEGVQVAPRDGLYRDELTIFRASEDLEVAVAIARNNPMHGAGGFRQVFIPDMQRLIDDGVLEVAGQRALHTLQARVHVDAAPAP